VVQRRVPAVVPLGDERFRPLLTGPEACALLRGSRTKLNRMVTHGDLPCVRVGGSLRFRLEDVGDYITKQRSKGGEA
jgi:excisionase family DNA binding protein